MSTVDLERLELERLEAILNEPTPKWVGHTHAVPFGWDGHVDGCPCCLRAAAVARKRQAAGLVELQRVRVLRLERDAARGLIRELTEARRAGVKFRGDVEFAIDYHIRPVTLGPEDRPDVSGHDGWR